MDSAAVPLAALGHAEERLTYQVRDVLVVAPGVHQRHQHGA